MTSWRSEKVKLFAPVALSLSTVADKDGGDEVIGAEKQLVTNRFTTSRGSRLHIIFIFIVVACL